MGLFSSKYETSVSASVSRVIADANLPNALKTGTLKAQLRNGDQGDYILEELVNGLALKTHRMYSYGGGAYTYGLPSGEVRTSNQGQAQVQAVLDALEGTPVDIEYNHFGPPNSLHIAWINILASYGYDPATNQLGTLTAAESTPVYLHDMEIVVPASTMPLLGPDALKQWGVSAKAGQSPSRPAWTPEYSWMTKHSPVHSPTGSGAPYAVLYWVKTVMSLTGLMVSSTPVGITVPLIGYDDAADYFQAKYKVGGVTKYFMYKVGTGTYPTLDSFYDTDPGLIGEFFPIVHFRHNKTSLATDKTSVAYKSSAKLVKYLGMNFEQIADGIDENPDIADIDQAMMIMAVPATSTIAIENRYLFEFFYRLFQTAPQTYTSNAMYALRTGDMTDDIKTSMVMKDTLFQFALNNSGIIRQMVVGTLGPVGSFHSAKGSTQVPYTYWESIGEGDRVLLTAYRTVYHFMYRKQVSNHAYEEIKVVDLTLAYQMNGLTYDVGDGNEPILLVPLDSTLTRTYSIKKREELYGRSLHYVFTSLVVTKVKWYEQFWFQALITVAAVVIAFVSGGAANLTAFMNTVLAGATSFSTIAMTLLTSLIEYLITTTVVQLFIKAVGAEAAFLLTIALVLAGSVDALRSGSIKGAPWASDLLKLASSLTKGISGVVQDQLLALQDEAESFGDYVKSLNKDLDVAQRLLEGSNRLDPLVLWGETPNEYFQRTVHSGNIGTLSISAVSTYVTNSLKLPKIEQTLGESLEY